eukprot:TRINITY_DN9985_c0_g2_i2.p1 TRINITY_DN9985_c0_g2~~TRINITY_DN9985_c0_g2_i2.p1  ORF type:complete len:171 (-),score=11.93 TRINITY_DN9985_c0_g2_i2:59-571(-)
MLRRKVSGEKADLTLLHNAYPWIPDENSIRPTPEERAKKVAILAEISLEWCSLRDFILHDVFQQTHFSFDSQNKKQIRHVSLFSEWKFKESIFRYQVHPDAHHYVLWNYYCTFEEEVEEAIVNEVITTRIAKLLDHSDFDFAWYKNPKPTVLDFYHVQVFWIDHHQFSKT